LRRIFSVDGHHDPVPGRVREVLRVGRSANMEEMRCGDGAARRARLMSTDTALERYAIDRAQSTALWNDGHLLLRGVATRSEIALHRKAIHDAVERLSSERRDLQDRDTYGKAFLQITNLWTKDEAVKR